MEEYASRLMEKVVAKMCEDIGFDATRASTLDTLIDIGRRYIEQIGEKASINAEIANRTSPNVLDLDAAFDELGISWEHTRQFFQETSDLKFPHVVPEPKPRKVIFCKPSLPEEQRSKEKTTQSEDELDLMDEEEDDKKKEDEKPVDKQSHIPEFLPKFPDEHTYRHTNVYPKRGGREKKHLRVKENSLVEKSLTDLHTGPNSGSVDRNYLEPAMSSNDQRDSKHWGSSR
ncbi:hypothetical protein AAMO2058_000004900 [Amorphochlora amoebiformis]